MAQAKIYWDLSNYGQVERIFRRSVEFCNEHDVWKLNVAHVLFMQVRQEAKLWLYRTMKCCVQLADQVVGRATSTKRL
jgi:hypothetical protein